MRVGVCSWSLACDSPGALARALGELGIHRVQLALDPIREGRWDLDETTTRLADIEIASAMMTMAGEDYSSIESITRTGGVRPDGAWEENLARARKCAEIAQKMNIRLVTFHAGFFPHEGDPLRDRMIERVRTIASIYADAGAAVGLETGQESIDALARVLEELSGHGVGVNFDPANMLLYGAGEPVQALAALMPSVRQVHAKDARPSRVSGEWGVETPVGNGEVDFAALSGVPGATDVDWIIEREVGESRMADIAKAIDVLGRLGAPRDRV